MIKTVKAIFKNFNESRKKASFTPSYRIVEISQLKHEEYVVTIQLINKTMTFHAKPEEILSNDDLVDQFSPRDVRTLTYLGYLSIHAPKYKILAQRLSETNDKTIFALRKKADGEVIVKTADEILKEKEILHNLCILDAHSVGYSLGIENILREKEEKMRLLQEKSPCN
jgi:hypothetical protein